MGITKFIPCKFFYDNTCRYGKKCRYLHMNFAVDPLTGMCSPADNNPNIRRSVVNDHIGVKYIQTEVLNTGMVYYSPQSAKDSFTPRSRQEIEDRHRELVMFRATVAARMEGKRRRKARYLARPTIASLTKQMAAMTLANAAVERPASRCSNEEKTVDRGNCPLNYEGSEAPAAENKEQLPIVDPESMLPIVLEKEEAVDVEKEKENVDIPEQTADDRVDEVEGKDAVVETPKEVEQEDSQVEEVTVDN